MCPNPVMVGTGREEAGGSVVAGLSVPEKLSGPLFSCSEGLIGMVLVGKFLREVASGAAVWASRVKGQALA